jgi:hypothetical protein
MSPNSSVLDVLPDRSGLPAPVSAWREVGTLAGGFFGSENGVESVEGPNHRLLAVDVFAGIEGGYGLLGVKHRRSQYGHYVHGRVSKGLFSCADDAGLFVAELESHLFGPVYVQIAQHTDAISGFLHAAQVQLADGAAADDRAGNSLLIHAFVPPMQMRQWPMA